MNSSQVYRMLTWLSPSFPIGSFSYSHGLENAIENGFIKDRESLQNWLTGILKYGTGRCEASLFCLAFSAIAAPICDWPLERVLLYTSAFHATAELRLESTAQGKAFLDILVKIHPSDVLCKMHQLFIELKCKPALAVAVALACASEQFPLELSLTGYLQSFTNQLVSAGTRLIPLGQTDSQHLMMAMMPVIQNVVKKAIEQPIEDTGSAIAMLELASMQHEKQYTRLFRS